MKRTLVLVLAVGALTACDRAEDTKAAAPAPVVEPAAQPAVPAADRNDAVDPVPGAPAVAADNTEKNERDREGGTLTPGDQKENPVDLGITQQIRQDVIKSDGLSMAARNVKIITADGVVTLRGPVETAKEKSTIAAIAKQANGAKRVDNQLEVAAK